MSGSPDSKYNIKKISILVISMAFGAMLGSFAASLIVYNYKYFTIESSDAIGIANTYIFFISIIFILFTIGITLFGYFYTKERAKEIHQLIIILGAQLETDDGTRKLFIDEIFKNEKIKEAIESKASLIIEEIEKTSLSEESQPGELGV